MESEKTLTFADQVRAIPDGESLDKCYACGTCVSRCLIQQKGDPGFNPRRLFHLVMLEETKEAFQNPTTWLCTACDLCFPACPQEIRISGVLNAVRQLALEADFQPSIQAAWVNQKTCVGCGLCEQVCPYQAITLAEADIPFRGKGLIIAQVDSDKCMACGLCETVCRSTSIAINQPQTSESVIGDMHAWIQAQGKRMTV